MKLENFKTGSVDFVKEISGLYKFLLATVKQSVKVTRKT